MGKIWTKVKKVNEHPYPLPKEIHRLDPKDLKICIRERNQRL
jgi:hypothetical protein